MIPLREALERQFSSRDEEVELTRGKLKEVVFKKSEENEKALTRTCPVVLFFFLFCRKALSNFVLYKSLIYRYNHIIE